VREASAQIGAGRPKKGSAMLTIIDSRSPAISSPLVRNPAKATVLVSEFIKLIVQHDLGIGKSALGELVFPDSPNRPALGFQRCLLIPVSSNISGNLRDPVLDIGQRCVVMVWTSVKEAAVSENHQPQRWDHDVGTSWHRSDVPVNPPPVPQRDPYGLVEPLFGCSS
jgi:hypothetical protein